MYLGEKTKHHQGSFRIELFLVVFMSPNAPQKCDLNPLGYQWFDFQSGDPALIWKGVLEAARILNSFIDEQLEKYNLSDDNLALIGFSQGTMMSLHVGLRREKPMRALVGFSGKLIGEGPTHVIPSLVTFLANEAFSDKKP